MLTTVINIRSAPRGWERDARYVYIGRAGRGFPGTWGNPHQVGFCHACSKPGAPVTHQRGEAVSAYKRDLSVAPLLTKNALEQLRGKILVCFCKPLACHGDVIAEYLNK